MKSLFLAGALALLTTPVMAQDGAELKLVKQIMQKAQALSFKNNREYCGYLAFDANDDVVVTKMTKGQKESCLADDFNESWTPFASFHTHGAHVDGESFELPSYSDAEGDEEEGIDGYVATPGGRLWYIDSQERTINLICGLGCVPQDPRFNEHPDDEPYDFYTYEELRKQEL